MWKQQLHQQRCGSKQLDTGDGRDAALTRANDHDPREARNTAGST
jgi:hypothetical protein